ncbi:MAG: tetratricopeptide repeat protein [Scytonema sp. PMC 1069.18]|nr:tetratricopeptide repeat protein [Scytonema sp. PMC 1069.18]MEC4883167.1 tetratricopeptide repeat protein [Scytonema sp. PMC 1070.18]
MNENVLSQQADFFLVQGIEYYETQEFEAALASWEQVLNIYREIGDRYAEAVILGSIGSVYHSLQQHRQAIVYHQNSLAIKREIGGGIPEQADSLQNIGAAYYNLGEYHLAVGYHEQCRLLRQQISDLQGEAESLKNIGEAYYLLNQYQQAIDCYQQSLQLKQTIGDHAGVIDCMDRLGASNYRLGKYQQTIDYYQQSLQLKQTIGDRLGEADSLRSLGNVYSVLGQYDQSIEYCQKSLTLAHGIDNLQLQGYALGELGNLHYLLGKYQQAINYHQQSLDIKRKIATLPNSDSFTNRRGEASSLTGLGNAYCALGQYDRAIESHQRAFFINREISNLEGEMVSLGNLGNVFNLQGKYQEAVDSYQESLSVAQKIGNHRSQAQALLNCGNAYFYLGQFFQALDYYQQSLDIAQQNGNVAEEVTALGNLGNTYEALGKYQKALDYIQQLLPIKRRIGDKKGLAESLGALGAIYKVLRQYQKAIDYHQQSLAIKREIGDKAGIANSLGNLAGIYNSLKQFPQAFDCYQKALDISQEIGDEAGVAAYLGGLGSLFSSQGQYQQAINYLQQSLKIKKVIGDRRGEAKALGNLGNFYQATGELQLAIDYYQRQLQLVQEIGEREQEGNALNNLGATLLQTNNLTAAESILYQGIEVWESLRFGLEDVDKVSIFDGQALTYRTLQEVLVAQNKIEDALVISERGRARAFVELLTERLSLQKVTQLTQSPPTLSEIKQIAQQQNSTIVEYSIVDSGNLLLVWVVKSTGEITCRLVNLQLVYQKYNTSLENLVADSREVIGARGRSTSRDENIKTQERDAVRLKSKAVTNINYKQRLQQLYQILIQPISDLLPTDDFAHVIFIPQSYLFLVPFPALCDPNENYLIEKHTILTAPSIQLLGITRKVAFTRHEQQQLNSSESTKHALVVGNPTMPKIVLEVGQPPQQLNQLLGAQREAIAISSLLQVEPITGEQATKAWVVQQMLDAKIIHLATHGLLDERKGMGVPGAIALAPCEQDDGVLVAEEILNLKLNAELVVLSACNTGRGNLTGDGVIGLSRCFIIAGVPSIVVSLWAVPDSATMWLMTEFYENLQRGLDKAQALRQAMLETKKQNPNPKAWAGFTLIGEVESLWS